MHGCGRLTKGSVWWTRHGWSDASSAVYLTDGDIRLADTGLVDESERALYASSSSPVAVAWGNGAWWVLGANDTGLNLLVFNPNLSLEAEYLLNVDVPSTVLSYEILVDDALYIRLEGLLTTSYLRSPAFNASFNPSTGRTGQNPQPWKNPLCPHRATERLP